MRCAFIFTHRNVFTGLRDAPANHVLVGDSSWCSPARRRCGPRASGDDGVGAPRARVRLSLRATNRAKLPRRGTRRGKPSSRAGASRYRANRRRARARLASAAAPIPASTSTRSGGVHNTRAYIATGMPGSVLSTPLGIAISGGTRPSASPLQPNVAPTAGAKANVAINPIHSAREPSPE